MNVSPPKIVVIDDELVKNDPLLVSIKEKYGENNTLLFSRSEEGLDFVLTHLNQKLIVLLDLNFESDEPSGVDIFESIREKTALVYIIIITANPINSIDNVDLIKFINNDALGFVQSSDDYSEIINLIDKASHQLDVRVDSVLEEWISKLSNEEREKPYIKIREGQEFSLNEILSSIRNQGEIGKLLEKNILKLAVDLLIRQKRDLND